MAKPQSHNPVAKFAQRFNRCEAFTDKKKRAKKGYTKHKRAEVFTSALLFCWRVSVVFCKEPSQGEGEGCGSRWSGWGCISGMGPGFAWLLRVDGKSVGLQPERKFLLPLFSFWPGVFPQAGKGSENYHSA